MEWLRVIRWLVTFVLLGLVAIGFGARLALEGVRRFYTARIPLTQHAYLTGWPARIAAVVLIVFGVIVVISGLAVAGFCFWRLPQVLRGG